MRWVRRRGAPSPLSQGEQPIVVGGDRLVFWKAKSEEVDGEIYGPVWISDANDPEVTLEEPDAWLTREQAQEFARKPALPFEEV